MSYRLDVGAIGVHKSRAILQNTHRPAAAEEAAVDLLRTAVLAVEEARGAKHDRSTTRRAHQGLPSARWSLIESFTHDGRHYLIAREVAAQPVDLGTLTPRERQIVGHACLCHDNKVIAYDLLIAHSTVKVLMARAAAKLGVGSRDALIATFRARWQAVVSAPRPEAVEHSTAGSTENASVVAACR